MKRAYETIFIVDAEIGEDAIQATIEKFKALIEKAGEIESLEEWGNRKLAYEIKDRKSGYYVFVTHQCAPDFPVELERNFKITESILKYLVIRKES